MRRWCSGGLPLYQWISALVIARRRQAGGVTEIGMLAALIMVRARRVRVAMRKMTHFHRTPFLHLKIISWNVSCFAVPAFTSSSFHHSTAWWNSEMKAIFQYFISNIKAAWFHYQRDILPYWNRRSKAAEYVFDSACIISSNRVILPPFGHRRRGETRIRIMLFDRYPPYDNAQRRGHDSGKCIHDNAITLPGIILTSRINHVPGKGVPAAASEQEWLEWFFICTFVLRSQNRAGVAVQVSSWWKYHQNAFIHQASRHASWRKILNFIAKVISGDRSSSS